MKSKLINNLYKISGGKPSKKIELKNITINNTGYIVGGATVDKIQEYLVNFDSVSKNKGTDLSLNRVKRLFNLDIKVKEDDVISYLDSVNNLDDEQFTIFVTKSLNLHHCVYMAFEKLFYSYKLLIEFILLDIIHKNKIDVKLSENTIVQCFLNKVLNNPTNGYNIGDLKYTNFKGSHYDNKSPIKSFINLLDFPLYEICHIFNYKIDFQDLMGKIKKNINEIINHKKNIDKIVIQNEKTKSENNNLVSKLKIYVNKVVDNRKKLKHIENEYIELAQNIISLSDNIDLWIKNSIASTNI